MNTRYLVLVFTLMLGNVIADDVTESEPNNTLATAQDVDSHFITGANPDIGKRLGNYRIDPTYSGLPFLNSAAADPPEPAPI